MPRADVPEGTEPSHICFLAIDVPRMVGEGIAGWVRPLLEAPARPVKPDRFHVTLVYYGGVAAHALGDLTTEIAAHTSGPSLCLEPGSPGRFGRGHMLWVSVEGDVARLATLRGRLFAATSGYGTASAESGEGPEAEYVPHITVARIRGRSRPPRRFLESRPERNDSLGFVADRLTLFESAGSRYRVLTEFPLEGDLGRP
jgi:2'-5' RNA ligase